MSYFTEVGVRLLDSPSLDAFSRLRISEPEYLFDSNFIYDLQPLLFEKVTAQSGATVTHDSTNSAASMAFSSTPTGGKAYLQTYEHFRYQAGRSQLILATFNFIEAKAGVLKFVGYSDGVDGVEFQLTGEQAQFVMYSSTAKGNETVGQSNWNLDPLDGTGPSGITLDLTKTQILVIDLQWLGVGRVRVGFDIGGVLVYCHAFVHANIQTVPYMKKATLPVRAGMTCTSTVSTTMRFICVSVMSEGGEPEAGGFFQSYISSVTAGSGTRTHALSLRPAATFNALTTRFKIVLDSLEIAVTGSNPITWDMCLGQAISGTTTYTAVNATYSGMEYNTAGTLSGNPALVVLRGAVSASAQSKGTVGRSISGRYPITLDSAGTARSLGTVTFTVTGVGGTSACYVVANWRELR